MDNNGYEYLYGPVPSRRLGRSLGVSMVPMKTCSLDCIYCQLGQTTDLTIDRCEYVPTEDILAEIEEWLHEDGRADYITFSGAGEPTLHTDIGRLMSRAGQLSDLPIALLTNGTLLWRDEVRQAAMNADLLMPSLDAATAEMFERVNRPCPELSIDEVINGLIQTVKTFSGHVWLEVMMVAGINDTASELDALADGIDGISPDRVQINTVVRPAPHTDAKRIDDGKLKEIQQALPGAQIIPSAWQEAGDETSRGDLSDVLALLNYRPCTIDDIAHGLDMHPNHVLKHISHLIEDGQVRTDLRDGETYYVKTSTDDSQQAT